MQIANNKNYFVHIINFLLHVTNMLDAILTKVKETDNQ